MSPTEATACMHAASPPRRLNVHALPSFQNGGRSCLARPRAFRRLRRLHRSQRHAPPAQHHAVQTIIRGKAHTR
eukprot:3875219-Pleurochrysis_carterae.AAC.4